jgi:hypothetical protein
MRIKARIGVLALGAAVMASGCQTYFGGMTLPSGHYLQHPPQYFPPDPTFPLQREVDSMTDPDGTARRNSASAVKPIDVAPPTTPNAGVPTGR